MATSDFEGDLLAVNNEVYGSNIAAPCSPANKEPGGFDLYDVSDPENPVTLVRGFGDESPDDGTVEAVPEEAGGNSYHSVFVWQDGPKAYLVGVDNIELHDVDIYDITDPRNPEFLAEYDLRARFPQIEDESALGDGIFLHDMVVKEIDERQVMLASYWDAGYVQLDVTDPLNPTYISDTNFDGADPLTGFSPPSGNAHYAEFSHDNSFILAADEEFAPYRLDEEIDGTTEVPPFDIGIPISAGAPTPGLLIVPGDPLEGPTRYVGNGCDPAAIPDAPAEPTIAVVERGGATPDPMVACGFELKAANVEAAGYDGVVIINNVGAVDDGLRCDATINLTFSDPSPVTIQTILVPRSAGFKILGLFDETYTCVAGNPGASSALPAPPVDGLPINFAAVFDGWGYSHVFDAATSEEIEAFALPEALDERYADGFGDLSIHEWATDPTENLAYTSYYSGGMRVFDFGPGGLTHRGAYIDSDGSNFWGVEEFTTPGGQRLIAGSDRDFGLQIFRYTGPGAAQRPTCSNVNATTAPETPVSVPLTCTDANGNPLSLRIGTEPVGGTLGNIAGGKVTYTPKTAFAGSDSFTYLANDGAADSAPATVAITVASGEEPGTVPSNRLGVDLARFKNGKLTVIVDVEAPGALRLGLSIQLPSASAARSVRIGRKSQNLSRAGTHRVTLKLKRAGRRKLARALAKSKRGSVRATVRLNWKPTGGTTRRASRKLRIRG